MSRGITRAHPLALEVGTLLSGREWHSEVYLKTGDDAGFLDNPDNKG